MHSLIQKDKGNSDQESFRACVHFILNRFQSLLGVHVIHQQSSIFLCFYDIDVNLLYILEKCIMQTSVYVGLRTAGLLSALQ